MSPEAQRIAIAEACGWTVKSQPCSHSASVTEWFWWTPARHGLVIPDYTCSTQRSFPSGTVSGNSIPEQVPDYLSDLNAMHEAEKVLTTPEQQSRYVEQLCRLLNDAMRESRRWIGATPFHYAHATAAQRAEAFLRTLGKWEASK